MSESDEREMDRYLRGDLSPAEARQLAQTALDRRGLFEDLTLAAVALHGVAAQPSSDALESYVTGRLSPSEQRTLAQTALADDELFDALAAHGAVEKSIQHPEFRRAIAGPAPQPAKVIAFPRRFRIAAIGAIAAAIAAVAIYLWKPAGNRAMPQPALTASLDPASGQPTLLASNLAPASATSAAPVFRSAEPDSRAPLPEGSVLAHDNFAITVNLGSLDGLSKGAALDVFHGASAQPIARLEATTIFRDRSRALIKSGASIQVNDRVRPAEPVYLTAVLDQVTALTARGDFNAARKIARDALAWADSNGIAPSQTRNFLEHLAQLDYKAGDRSAAERDYQSLAAGFTSSPTPTTAEQDAVFNAWGALLLLRGDSTEAASRFRQTHDASGLNNAGVLAELHGETANAQALYEAALRNLAPSAPGRDRQTIESNLSRLAKRK